MPTHLKSLVRFDVSMRDYSHYKHLFSLFMMLITYVFYVDCPINRSTYISTYKERGSTMRSRVLDMDL